MNLVTYLGGADGKGSMVSFPLVSHGAESQDSCVLEAGGRPAASQFFESLKGSNGRERQRDASESLVPRRGLAPPCWAHHSF